MAANPIIVFYKELFFKKRERNGRFIVIFVFLEGFLYGFGIWWFSYLYIWSLLACIVLLLHGNASLLFWGIVSGFFGLSFGAPGKKRQIYSYLPFFSYLKKYSMRVYRGRNSRRQRTTLPMLTRNTISINCGL